MSTNWNDLLKQAKNENWTEPPEVPENRITRAPSVDGSLPSKNDGSQDYYAQVFAHAVRDEYRYLAEAACWYKWNGYVWEEDLLRTSFEELREFIRAAAPTDKRASLLNRPVLSSIEALTRSTHGIVTSINSFDQDAYVLNTPGGVVDLYTGTLHEPDPQILVRRSTSVVPVDAPTPLWDQMLSQVFAGDAEASRYLETALGLALIGNQDEHLFFMLSGVGGSGKGTIISLAQRILGTGETGYAMSVEASFLMARRTEGHPEQYARLAGKRLVSASEASEHETFDAARVKNLTGGDLISGRFMNKNTFTFMPTWSLFLMTNYRPKVSDEDTGFWRRFREIPFRHRPPQVIKGLADHIYENEGGAILNRLVERASEYLHKGLTTPDAVLNASRENQHEQDTVKQFVLECCENTPDAHTPVTPLYEAYERWCKSNKRTTVGTKTFGDKLEGFGYVRGKKNGSRGHFGLEVASTYSNSPY